MDQIGESVKAVIHSDGKILLQLRDEKPNIYYQAFGDYLVAMLNLMKNQ